MINYGFIEDQCLSTGASYRAQSTMAEAVVSLLDKVQEGGVDEITPSVENAIFSMLGYDTTSQFQTFTDNGDYLAFKKVGSDYRLTMGNKGSQDTETFNIGEYNPEGKTFISLNSVRDALPPELIDDVIDSLLDSIQFDNLVSSICQDVSSVRQIDVSGLLTRYASSTSDAVQTVLDAFAQQASNLDVLSAFSLLSQTIEGITSSAQEEGNGGLWNEPERLSFLKGVWKTTNVAEVASTLVNIAGVVGSIFFGPISTYIGNAASGAINLLNPVNTYDGPIIGDGKDTLHSHFYVAPTAKDDPSFWSCPALVLTTDEDGKQCVVIRSSNNVSGEIKPPFKGYKSLARSLMTAYFGGSERQGMEASAFNSFSWEKGEASYQTLFNRVQLGYYYSMFSIAIAYWCEEYSKWGSNILDHGGTASNDFCQWQLSRGLIIEGEAMFQPTADGEVDSRFAGSDDTIINKYIDVFGDWLCNGIFESTEYIMSRLYEVSSPTFVQMRFRTVTSLSIDGRTTQSTVAAVKANLAPQYTPNAISLSSHVFGALAKTAIIAGVATATLVLTIKLLPLVRRIKTRRQRRVDVARSKYLKDPNNVEYANAYSKALVRSSRGSLSTNTGNDIFSKIANLSDVNAGEPANSTTLIEVLKVKSLIKR